MESDPKEIEDGTEIKISDSILKIEILNNSKKSKNNNTKKIGQLTSNHME